ncbi:DUF308 domain-containing protein [Mycetocola zhujimingii]|uniref:DUF4190 domain-containing protein n=1 Tax=Mycetocola zhujimingii TaxID=2079792 RepID=A0A2U1TC30_9MICO|nr:DUF308 domain-containing protein [Mycetocola zhujimingii]PWC06452.1 hypothetical protein DF223_12740 [Mycetocola zhujimingii]
MTNPPPSPYGSAGEGNTQQPPYPAQPPYNASQFYRQDQPHYGYVPVGGQGSPKPGNGPGLASLIIGIVSVGVAFIPFANFLSFLLGVTGIVLGIIGLVLADRPRGQAIWGTVLSFVSLVLAAVMIVAYTFGFIFAIGEAVDETPRARPGITATPEPRAAVESLTLGSPVEFVDTDGETVYLATVTAYDLDATDLVLAVEGNPVPPEGMNWAMVSVAAAPRAQAGTDPGEEITVEYLAADGNEVYSATDDLNAAPDPDFTEFTDVALNETVVGNIVIPIPSDDPGGGLIALSYSGAEGTDGPYYFAVD